MSLDRDSKESDLPDDFTTAEATETKVVQNGSGHDAGIVEEIRCVTRGSNVECRWRYAVVNEVDEKSAGKSLVTTTFIAPNMSCIEIKFETPPAQAGK